MPKARICITDDHELFRDGVVQLLNHQVDLEVVGIAGDGLEIVSLAHKQKPDLILMDISMPISDGIEGTRLIREFDADVKILILTALDSDEKLIDAIKAGADGYILKKSNSESFLRAVRSILAGEATLPRNLTTRLVKEFAEIANRPQPAVDLNGDSTLTFREIQVLELIAAGSSNQQISERLGISISTTKSHVRNLLEKLGAESRWEAARIAENKGLLRAHK